MPLSRRKLFTLFLTAYLLAIVTPFFGAPLAKAETVFQCKLPGNYAEWDEAKVAGGGAENEAYNTWKKGLETIYGNVYKQSSCGALNDTTKLYEKGDCSKTDEDGKGGKIVTEITEPIAPSVKLDANTFILDVYQGSCCLAPYKDPQTGKITCSDVRTIYTDTYTHCTENGINCQQRQWLIASSGIGLLKLFVKQVYTWGAFAVGFIALGTIIFNGFKISMSGVSGDVSDSKNKILQAISGIVLLFLSSLILYTINPDFFG